jgi:flagellar basal-body rod modification protein FlgD
MAAAAGFLNHSLTAGQSLLPLDSSTSGTGSTSGSSGSSSSSSSSSSDSGSATISANDFLQLLVTEMQNQDPTDETDPNEYIDQLVDVNSLEQLININQTLTGAFPAASSSDSGDAASAQTAGVSATPSASALTAAGPQATGSAAAPSSISGALAAYHPGGVQTTATPQAVGRAPGNLSVPAANPAAQRVAHALDGRPRAKPLGGKLSRFEQTALNNRP